MSLFYNFLCQNLSRYKLFIFFTKIVFKLSFFFINKHDKENYKLWLKYRNKKQKIFKGYLIYNCTLNPTWIGFHLQQIFFLQCFYLNGYVPIILNGRLLEKIYRNLNFITLDNIFKYLPKKINITSISRKISKLKFHQKKNFK